MIKDYTGQKFGRLTFIKPTKEKSQRSIVWELVCDCGNFVYVRGVDVARGQTHSCGCLATELRQRKLYNPVIASARTVWRIYKKDGITFEQFFELSQKNCYYCNIPPSTTWNMGLRLLKSGKNINPLQIRDGYFTYNGLDRIDSNKLHTLDNVVPCCSHCNYMKRDMSVNDFIKHINKIHSHLEVQTTGSFIHSGNGPDPLREQNLKTHLQSEA